MFVQFDRYLERRARHARTRAGRCASPTARASSAIALSALREVVEGGPVDVVTGDYLAEVTMLILARHWMRDPSRATRRASSASSSPSLARSRARHQGRRQRRRAQPDAARGDASRDARREARRRPQGGHVEGDNLAAAHRRAARRGHPLANLDTGKPSPRGSRRRSRRTRTSAAWGIVAALRGGADIVVCPVACTDASLVAGAGGVVAGVEARRPGRARRRGRGGARDRVRRAGDGRELLGLPRDRGSRCTRASRSPRSPRTGRRDHEAREDGGAVSVGTVTAQLVYEVGGAKYLNPDVIASLDTVRPRGDGTEPRAHQRRARRPHRLPPRRSP